MKYHARNLPQLYKEHGPAKASMLVEAEIIEHIGAMNEQMNELTRTMDKMIDMIAGIAGGYKALRDNVEKIRGKVPEDEQ